MLIRQFQLTLDGNHSIGTVKRIPLFTSLVCRDKFRLGRFSHSIFREKSSSDDNLR